MAKNPYFDDGEDEEQIASEIPGLGTGIEGIPLYPKEVIPPAPTRPTTPEKIAVPMELEDSIPIPFTIPLPSATPTPSRPADMAPKVPTPPVARPSIPMASPTSVAEAPQQKYDEREVPSRDLYAETEDRRARVSTYAEDDYEDAIQVEPVTNTKNTNKKNGRNKFAEKKDSNSGKFNVYDGGRWKVLTLRITVWVVLGIVTLAGLKSLFLPNKVNVTSLSNTVATQIGFNGFPVLAGQDFAKGFLKEYLTLSKTGEPLREKILATYLPGGVIQPWAQANTPISSQIVVDGPFMMGAPELAGSDTTRAVYTFEAQVASSSRQEPTPVFLRVPVYNENGVLAITAPPGFFANPGVTVGDGHISYPVSAKDSQDFKSPLDKFLTAWANSDATTINEYTTSDSTAAVKTGMNGTVSFISETNLGVQLVSAKNQFASRRADVDITWSANGNTWVQGYQLTVTHSTDGKWYVQDIISGDFWAIPTQR